jgi:putative transcriptional regulator
MGDMVDQVRTGMLLVAAPPLGDPNFRRTVVLVIEHGENGSLGVVLNRSTRVPVAAILPQWGDVVGDDDAIFRGGPVGPNAVLALAELRPGSGAVPETAEVLPRVHMVDLDEDPTDAYVRMRFFSGYAGWAPDQLDHELAQHAWIVVPAVHDDVFTSEPDELWKEVLRRQPYPVSLMASFPEDPTQN